MSNVLKIGRSRWGITLMLTVAVATVITLLLTLLTVLDIRRERSLFRDGLMERSILLANGLNDTLAAHLYMSDVDALRDMADLVRSQSDISFVQISAPDGRLLAGEAEAAYPVGYIIDEFVLGATQGTEPRLRFVGNSLELATPLLAGAEVLGVLHFGFSDESLRDEISDIILQHVWQGLIFVGIGLVLAYGIARYAARPLARLQAAATRIGSGDLATPVPIAGTTEAAALGRTMDDMRGELKELRSSLEQQVAERTGQLSVSNEALLHEISHRENAESEVRATYSRLAALMENLTSGVLFEDTSRRIVYANRRFCELFLIPSPDDIIGADWTRAAVQASTLFVESDRFVPRTDEIVQDLLPVKDEELSLLDGRRFERDFIPMGSGNDYQGNLWLYRDVTERRRQEERLRETSRLVSVGELAAGVAHEINNPLAVIAGTSELMLDRGLELPPDPLVERIHYQADRASRIVQNLLSFARRSEPEKRYIDIREVLERALGIKVHEFRVSGIRVIRDWPKHFPRTMADEYQMVQVVVNILTNAQHAMVDARGGGELRVLAGVSSDKIRVRISDDGPGIPPEHVTKIFDPFFTTKGVDVGTGLGLSTCYGIVRQHGGEIWAESAPGEGAIFHIEIPLTSPEPEEWSEDLAPVPATTLRGRILVVDDEPDLRDLLSETLSEEGYDVALAVGGQQGWEMVQTNAFDCVLVDLKMPGMDGWQLLALIEKWNAKMAERVIFITGAVLSEDVRGFMASTERPILRKPFTLDELRHLVRASVEVGVPIEGHDPD